VRECKTCGTKYADICMIKNNCYLCTLADWPPKNKKQVERYKKAVAVRLALASPLKMAEAVDVVNRFGLERLEELNGLPKGKIVSTLPGNTFYQRIIEWLEGGESE